MPPPPPPSTLARALAASLALVLLNAPSNAQAGGRRGAAAEPCAPVSTASPFDLDAYAAHAWYVQQQQVVRYQPRESLYCVRASYRVNDDDAVDVYNTANVGGVDGPPQNSDGFRLRAVIDPDADDDAPSKLRVGPRFLPRFLYGPYWVVAVSPSEPRDESDPVGPGYDWAIVSGGQPTIPTGDDGKCRTGSGQNDSGFWLFTREKIASEATLEEMRAVASEKGFDLSALEPVTHEGCEYPEE
ncbi:uncharacterized protein MICPUCDRAFT_41142 [Micromonas pusilla CCMP1545]|uniref:Lipocalin/cytosolic fatty-acid binding domain-containing protein n=1 Tax=Micromonas pusilla (strain CCMP1545) TaxID=564608 RepID=C1MYT2_MICPC|nr:uncharacterized protein MICPUCDRAFT_41142 [Micromonas pusilla CCMP1545]EEH54488.1 hypothetical protein MICPUCDRAFT_41142 [Micromonas pusilla CCMP1545]|eukprot:XP_003060838.1 hypothetical protein MICPUCDRAFT_41142 [Micromonas pusilla CCMP1545]